MNIQIIRGALMFGINSQTASQDTGVIGNYNQETPLGGDQIPNSQQMPGAPQSTAPPSALPPQQSVTSSIPTGFGQVGLPTQDSPAADQASDELIDIKKDALQQLTPLVGHLDQSPEEKFRTTMMLIQATDDKSLLKTAYQSALQIADEKSKAQALLDVVNEINYFTHPELSNQ